VEDQDKIDIHSCLRGDKNAYASIIRRHQARISRLMWRFCRHRQTCEELVQEVFVQAWLSLKDYRGDAPFEHWLSRIATFIGYRYWKQQAADKKRLAPTQNDLPAPTQINDMDLTKRGDMLHDLMARLDPEQRLVLTLLYFEECSIKDIARRMKWTVSKTKVRAFRARKKLRQIADDQNFLERIGWTP